MKNILQIKKAIIFFTAFFLSFNSYAQQSFYRRIDGIPVYQYGRQLAYPWVGGMNSPQFSVARLDSLGVSLLVVFDRSGEHFYTFLNQGINDSLSYEYAPQYEKNFPVCHNWSLIRDYNCDGIPDLFSSTYSGVDVYRGFYNTNGEWDFKLASPLLEFPTNKGPTNVYVPASDIPAIDDISGDGTMDILAFGPLGGYINYYKNTSEKNGHGCDSLTYVWQSPCWGRVYENYYLTMYLNVCAGFIGIPRSGNSHHNEAEHHAGNTLCSFDEDSSGFKSILWGGITFPYSDFLHNKGLNDTAYIDWQDTTFPSYNIPDSIESFPAAYSLDVNNDGHSDLLFAPNNFSGSEDYDEIRYYQQIPGKPTGTKAKQYYGYQNDSIFSKDMIDIGSYSKPAFFHYFNVDTSVYDLVVASSVAYNINNIPDASLTLYRNTGTKKNPSFQLVTKNFASISNLALTAVKPAFGDLRNTGTEDMILGNSNGNLYYFKNVAPIGSPAQYQILGGDSGVFFDSIQVGSFSAPQLVDVDSDGLLDLVIGCQDGILYYYHNNGDATPSTPPSFTLVSSNWGNVYVANEGYFTGNSDPFLYRDSTGKFVLLVGSLNGTIFRYDSINNNLTGNFVLTDSSFSNINTGFLSQSTISGAPILSNANPEFAVGNIRGGISMYTNGIYKSSGLLPLQKLWMDFNLYPNPADDEITISLAGVSVHDIVKLDIEDILGRTLISNTVENSQTKIVLETAQLPAGLYLCRITIGGDFVVRKFIVSHKD